MAILELDIAPVSFRQGTNGNSWTRPFRVSDLSSGPSIPNLINEALVALPDPGTAAPFPIVNQFLNENVIEAIQPVANSNPTRWQALGVILYSTPNPSVGGTIGEPNDNGPVLLISSVSSIEEIDTDRDRSGAQIKTTFDNVTMAHRTSAFRTGRAINVQRVESSNPRARQTAHEGTLNNATWNGYAAETVLLQSIDWDTDDQGVSYSVTYTFVIRPQGFKFRAVHEDPFFPGHPLPDASGAAVSEVDMIFSTNFADLNITLPS